MKPNWQLFAGLGLGLILGLACRPYTITKLKFGPIEVLTKTCRITGTTWKLHPADSQWQKIEPPFTPPTSIPTWDNTTPTNKSGDIFDRLKPD